MPLYSEQKKAELFNNFLSDIESTFIDKAETEDPDIGKWAVKNDILLDGKPFSFRKHEYLIEPYSDRHPFQVEIKGTQLGLTSKALLRVFHTSRYGGDKFKGIGYYFPSRSDVTDLSKIRITGLIEDNPDNIGTWIKETDAANVKNIWGTALYLRGMKSRVGMKCHDDQTEVLTKRGWKLFRDCDLTDEFATRSPSGVFMWQRAVDIYRYKYSGDMIHYLAGGLDVCVTPQHRLLLTNTDNGKYEWFDTAYRVTPGGHTAVVRTCKKWVGSIPDFIGAEGREENGAKHVLYVRGNKINKGWEHCGRHPDRKINLKDFVALLGLYVSEGSCDGVRDGVRKNGRIHISQSHNSKHFNDIKTLLNKTPFTWTYSKHDFRASDMGLADHLFPMGNKYTKHLPLWVLDLPVRYLEILWEWAMKGDGHISKTGQKMYATVSPVLAGQFQELLQKCGRSASVLVQKHNKQFTHILKDGREIKSQNPCYLVSERKSSRSRLPFPQIVPYDGDVWCASVPNGTLYTRRNGYAVWSGNSAPMDLIVFDELDEAPPKSVDMILERMAHSEVGELLFLSNPTMPDYGIDKLFCIAPKTKILTANLRWKMAYKLKVGEELIGFDEEKIKGNKTRCYRRTKVVSKNKIHLPSVKIYFDDGMTVICSKQHRWLTEIGGNVRFKIAQHMKVGDKVLSIGMWRENQSQKAGWISGIFDGEGSVGCSKSDKLKKRGTATYISFTQNPGIVMERVKGILSGYGFDVQESIGHKEGCGHAHGLKINGGLPERLRFMGTFRPVRLLPKASVLWEGRSVGNDAGNTKKPKVIKTEQLGIQSLIALGTEHKTFIANGLLSHNSTTDMRYWLLKCPKCNHYTNLVDTFPDCLITVKGEVIRACEKCHAKLNPSMGEWVAKRPQVEERRGRQYSQLFSQTKMTTPDMILQTYRTTNNLTDFYNLKIGIAYVEAQNRLSVKEVLDCCGTAGIASESDVGTFMGVDQGNHLHVVIGKRGESRTGEVIHVAVHKGNDSKNEKDESGWFELDALMKRFKVIRCVVDALPNTKFARNFAERHRGRVYMNFYNEFQKGSLRWNDKELIVQGNRTETLDASHNLISTQNTVLPRESDIMQTFALHMHNVAKRLEVDDESGSQRYVYLRLGDDHFRHAYNYYVMCLQGCPEYMFADLM